MRLISAVMGGRTFKGRESESKNCLLGFRFFETVNPIKAGKEFASEPALVRRQRSRFAGVDKDVYLTIPRGRMKDLKASYVLNNTELHARCRKTGLSAPLTSSWMVKPSTSVRWWSCRKFRKVISSAKLLITLN